MQPKPVGHEGPKLKCSGHKRPEMGVGLDEFALTLFVSYKLSPAREGKEPDVEATSKLGAQQLKLGINAELLPIKCQFVLKYLIAQFRTNKPCCDATP